MAAIARPTSQRGHKTSYDVFLDDAALAGLVGEMAEDFEANFDESIKKVVPVSHCWTPTGDIYCGCQGGQLLKADTEKNQVQMMLRYVVAIVLIYFYYRCDNGGLFFFLF